MWSSPSHFRGFYSLLGDTLEQPRPETDTQMTKLDGIQVLRGLAALVVALFHFHLAEPNFGPDQVTPSILGYGRIGVDLFFVISGFIMVHVTRNVAPSWGSSGNFLYKRAARIYPPYWVVTIGVLAIWFASSKALFGGVVGEAPNIPASLALWPTEQEPALNVGWTLIHEMYFYFAFALILLAPPKFRLWAITAWGAVIVAIWAMGWHDLSPPLKLITSPLTLEFIMGALVASHYKRLGSIARLVALLAGSLWIIGAMVYLGFAPTEETFADTMVRAIAFGPGATLLLLSATGPGLSKAGWPDGSIKLGDWSYALYLVHQPILIVFVGIWMRFFAGPGPLDNIIALVLYLIVTIIASAVFYYAVERPSLKLARIKFSRKPASRPT